jgi:HNH endonuclease
VRVKRSTYNSCLLLIGALIVLAVLASKGGVAGLVVGLVVLGLWAVYDLRITFGRSTSPTSPRPVVKRHSRTIPQDVKIAVTVRDGGKCRMCGSTKDLQYDHVIPWSKGGRSDDPNNIQLLCGYHNRLKGNR